MRVFGALCAATCLPAALAAQSIRGQVLDAATSAPIVSALIEVRADSGGTVIRKTTDRTGRYFIVLPGPGRYHIGIAAIGYTRKRSEPLEMIAGVRVLDDVRLQATTVQLAELVTQGSGSKCRLSPEANQRVSRMLDAAGEALKIMRTTIDAGTLQLSAEWLDRTVLFTPGEPLIEADTTRMERLTWPIQAGAAEVLEIRGFATEGAAAASGGWEFFAPDADVLFAPWFLASHCFDASVSDGGDTLTVSFRPVRRQGDRVDIAGRLVLDARTLVLRRLEFEHQNLPRGMPAGSVGGAIDFALTAQGTWLPVRWGIYAPIGRRPDEVISSSGRRMIMGGTRVVGRREVLGRLLLDGP